MALYKGDVMLAGVSNGFNPASAGTTGQILTKTASGYDWDDAPDSSNVKAFYLEGTTGATNLAIAQEAYDWYVAGKTPIVLVGGYSERAYVPVPAQSTSTQLVFEGDKLENQTDSTRSFVAKLSMTFTISSGTVTAISLGMSTAFYFLAVNQNYPTPYTPQYPGSPATKKYVDDNAGMKLAPNSPLSPKYHWFGTEAQYKALSQYYTDEANDTVYYTI